MQVQEMGLIAGSLLGAWLVNWLIDLIQPRLARLLARYSDRADDDRVFQLRRLETFVGIGAAVARVLVVCAALYLIWRHLMPTTAPVALIGASAFFGIVAGSTLGPLLRDLTVGTAMIAERWYHVGDYITVIPFVDVSGVVEAVTPRSTKLRALNGEAVFLHNQHIQGVQVMRRGVRTIALDMFVNNLAGGRGILQAAMKTLPTGPTMVARQLSISETEKLGDGLWRITATGQTMPGREWLLLDFAVKTILKCDELAEDGPYIVHGPIASYSDATAERRFRRMVRTRG